MQHNGSATTLRPLPVSMAGTALSPPRGVDVGVGVVVLMPIAATSLVGVVLPSLATSDVLLLRDSFEMSRIDTRSIPTEMIKL